jgi:hypothetical protein
MYDTLIDSVLETFARPDESERQFLERVQQADLRLKGNYATSSRVSDAIYADPEIRAAYLLRYLGHYTFQLADLLMALDGTPVRAMFARPQLRVASLCGGPCPEAIALASLQDPQPQRRLEVHVLDRNADDWADCWPIATAIAATYPGHADLRISGSAIDVLAPQLSTSEAEVLARTDVFTAMNCLNELLGVSEAALRRGLAARLDGLPSGAVVLASDLAGYLACERGLTVLHQLLEERGARILLAELNRATPHEAENRLEPPRRISWMYGQANRNNFRIFVKQLRLAALLP